MNTVHPLLDAARECVSAAKRARNQLLHELLSGAPEFLSTVAINFWSPYLPCGRDTVLGYPKNEAGESLESKDGDENLLLKTHHRYLTLLGRNVSANHLFVEVDNVSTIIVDGLVEHFDGPHIASGSDQANPITLLLHLPLRKPEKDICFATLVPPGDYDKWLGWLKAEDYECRHQAPLREELRQRRLVARKRLPKAFGDHLSTWIERNWVPSHVGLSDFDDRWLARVQLTALAAAIWGDIWITHAMSLGNAAHKALRLQASCTVTGQSKDNSEKAIEKFRADIEQFAMRCKLRLESLIAQEFRPIADEVEALDHEPWEEEIRTAANKFSRDLGGLLISHNHEGEYIGFRGVLTPGLDALRIGPTQVLVLHEIDSQEFEPFTLTANHDGIWWDLWKAYFQSNDLFLSRDGVALHFELVLTEDGNGVIPVPRHVVQTSSSLKEFLESAGDPPAGLLSIGFQTDRTMALHLRRTRGRTGTMIETRVQPRGNDFDWGHKPTNEFDWGVLRSALYEVLRLILTYRKRGFFTNAASSLLTLTAGQLIQLADGIAEVRRRKRTCLLFIGPAYLQRLNGTYWFIQPHNTAFRVEITRLGISFPIISQIPETFSEDFRNGFADAVAMDGETIVFSADFNNTTPIEGFEIDHRPGIIEAGRFVQLPQGTPSLLEWKKPKITLEYERAWEEAMNILPHDILRGAIADVVDSVPISKLPRSELLSLGTRHRKAAMTTMKVNSIVGITCSASGKLKVWVGGVPIAEIYPHADQLLPYLSRPEEGGNA